jgi:hypothetical protein
MSQQPFTLEQLAAFAAGKMDAAQRELVQQHLTTDAVAANQVARLREIAQVVATPIENPPAETIARAKALFSEIRRTKPASEGLWSKLQRVIADLTFDSRPQAALAGLRGASTSYQLSFQSELGEVDMEVEAPSPAHATTWRIMGQISATEGQRADVIALASSGSFAPFASAVVDEHGVFTLSTSPGKYDVLISMQDALMVVPGIELS